MSEAVKTTCELVRFSDRTTANGAYARYWKRLIDVWVSLMLIIVALVPMLIVALVIRMDTPGNPLFLQTRIGRNGRPFTMWKFRTMKSRSINALEFLPDEDGILRHKVRNDPRITPVGSFLRRTSVDELPQLVNVLMGQMSLIGPRPELPEIVRGYETWQHCRHAVRPGITGWWQVSGRSDLPMHEHTELDLYYVEELSLRLDLLIAKKTLLGVFRGIGAF